jgi:hypothetical protein
MSEVLSKRALRKKATAERTALFNITIDESPKGGGCVEYSGLADDALAAAIHRFIRQSVSYQPLDDTPQNPLPDTASSMRRLWDTMNDACYMHHVERNYGGCVLLCSHEENAERDEDGEFLAFGPCAYEQCPFVRPCR